MIIMMNAQEEQQHTTAAAAAAAANEVLVLAAARDGSLSGSSPSGNHEADDRQETTEEDDFSRGGDGLILLAQHQPNDGDDADDIPRDPSPSALSINLQPPLRNNTNSTQPLPAVQPPSSPHLDGTKTKGDAGSKEQFIIQKAHATLSDSSSQPMATTVSTESSSEGSSKKDNNSDSLASSEQGGGDDQKFASQQSQRSFPENVSNQHNKPLAATKVPLQEDSPRLVASLSLDDIPNNDDKGDAAAAHPPPPAHRQADHSRKQRPQQAVQTDAPLVTFTCTRDDDHNETGMLSPRLRKRKVTGQESPKQKCARSKTYREASSLPTPSTETTDGGIKAVVVARESERAENNCKKLKQSVTRPAIPSSGNAGVSASSTAGASLASAKVMEGTGVGALPEEQEARKLFLCQRNAMYARRKYARKKIETEVLQRQCLSLEDLNNRLKVEQRRLEGLVDQARQTIFFVDPVGVGRVLASMEATHPTPPSIRSSATSALQSTSDPLPFARIQQQQGSTAELSHIPVTQIPAVLHNFPANSATLNIARTPRASLSNMLGLQAETSNAVSATGFLNVESLRQLQALVSAANAAQLLSSRHGGDVGALLSAIQNPNGLELTQSAGALAANPVLGQILLRSQLQQAPPLSLLSRLTNYTQVPQTRNALDVGNLGALQGVQTNQSASQQLTQQLVQHLELQQLLQGATGGSTFPAGSSSQPNQSDPKPEQGDEYQRS